MSTSPDAQHLSFETARSIPENIDAFALEFCDPNTGEPKPLRWIDNPDLVSRFGQASGFRAALVDSPITSLQHRGYVRLSDGEVFEFNVYKLPPNAPGILTFAGGSTLASPDLYNVIREAYSLAFYDPRAESRRANMPAILERDTGLHAPTYESVLAAVEEKKRAGAPMVAPWVIVVWSDNVGQNHNQQWAAWFANGYLNTYTMQGAGLNAIATAAHAIRMAGNTVRQVIMSVHGTDAEFDLRSPADPFNSQYCCGLYANQTTGTQYANALSADMVANSTITLLSCDTANNAGGPDGRNLMQQIATALGCYVIASDAPVYVSAGGAACQPYTVGNIYRSTPGTPFPVVYIPAAPGNNIPTNYF